MTEVSQFVRNLSNFIKCLNLIKNYIPIHAGCSMDQSWSNKKIDKAYYIQITINHWWRETLKSNREKQGTKIGMTSDFSCKLHTNQKTSLRCWRKKNNNKRPVSSGRLFLKNESKIKTFLNPKNRDNTLPAFLQEMLEIVL